MGLSSRRHKKPRHTSPILKKQERSMAKGAKIQNLTYEEAEKLITEKTIITLPIGGGSKEHGSHLPMGTDYFVTDWIAGQVVERYPVLCLPTLPYGYFPAFVEWKGSVSVSAGHFSAYVRDILLSFTRFGVKKFLIIDGGVSTQLPLKILSRDMYNEYKVFVALTNISGLGQEVRDEVCSQERGGHADESETSCMLHINPALVHIEKAVEEYTELAPYAFRNGVLRVYTPVPMNTPHGINGNSTLASAEKGEKILHAMADDIVLFLENFDNIAEL
jgi:creatinine amidohydrolase